MVEIMHNEITPDTKKRTVKIEANYGDEISESFARFYENACLITRMTSHGKAKPYMLQASAMDALATSWLQYREDCRDADAREARRLAEVTADAYHIADTCEGGMKIEQKTGYYDDREYWNVELSKIYYEGRAVNPDDLLAEVQNAQASWDEHSKDVAHAYELAKDHPEIEIDESHMKDSERLYWNVNIQSDGWSVPVYNAQELIKYVEQAIRHLTSKLEAARHQQARAKKRTEILAHIKERFAAFPDVEIKVTDQEKQGTAGWRIASPDFSFQAVVHTDDELNTALDRLYTMCQEEYTEPSEAQSTPTQDTANLF